MSAENLDNTNAPKIIFNQSDSDEESIGDGEDEAAMHHEYLSRVDHHALSTQSRKLSERALRVRGQSTTARVLDRNETNNTLHDIAEDTEQFIMEADLEQEIIPHPIFTEMLELRRMETTGVAWKQVARWVKFEESVDEGGNRWSKPHVSSPALYSLSQVHTCIADGTDIIDMVAADYDEVIDKILDELCDSGEITEDKKEPLKVAFTAPKVHQFEHEASNKAPGRVKQREISGNKDRRIKHNHRFRKKLPNDAEAMVIFVAQMAFLSKRLSVFVRLANAKILPEIPEIAIPTRFLFLVIGPTNSLAQSRDIGRAMATLVTDRVFHDMPYRVVTKEELLLGVDEFLDEVTVLPPGSWNPQIRIAPPDVPSHQMKPRNRKSGTKRDKQQEEELKALLNVQAAHSHADDPMLQRTGRLFGGLIADIKRKLPYYKSDITDAFNMQCLATFLFMYFAILAPAVTFGGLLEEATNQRMAAIENVLSACLCGTVFHLIGGQPLTILGSTGPVLVFETLVCELCTRYDLEYLSFRFWINFWMAVILMILVATDASAMVRYISRFTEESFATLIALIFIVESCKKLYNIIQTYVHIAVYNPSIPSAVCDCMPPTTNYTTVDLNKWINKVIRRHHFPVQWLTNQSWITTQNDSVTSVDYANINLDYCNDLHGSLTGNGCYKVFNVFFMSLLLAIGTYVLATWFKSLRHSLYFPTWVRRILGDFAITLAMVIMIAIDYYVGIETPKLNVPDQLRPTWSGRGWFVDPFKNSVTTWFVAFIPASVSVILIFLDQNITSVIINRKDNKLKKGGGYHLDLFVIAIQVAVVGFLGFPVFVAATVRSINHMNSLKRQSETQAPGEKPVFMGVIEQRVTGFVTFLCIGLSVFLTPILKLIPMPCLYGVFLYMGLSALDGVQMVDRILLFIMPVKYQPDYEYLRHVRLSKVHLFTIIQVVCFVLMWVVKSVSTIAIIFPLMLIVMVSVRLLMSACFTNYELKNLDDELAPILCTERQKEKYEVDRKKSQMKHRGSTLKPGDDFDMIRVPTSNRELCTIRLSHVMREPSEIALSKHAEAALKNNSPPIV